MKKFLKLVYWDFNVILGKQKTPGDIPPGVFCFPQGKQKTPSAVQNLNQSKIWIALGVFYFPRIIKTPDNRILSPRGLLMKIRRYTISRIRFVDTV